MNVNILLHTHNHTHMQKHTQAHKHLHAHAQLRKCSSILIFPSVCIICIYFNFIKWIFSAVVDVFCEPFQIFSPLCSVPCMRLSYTTMTNSNLFVIRVAMKSKYIPLPKERLFPSHCSLCLWVQGTCSMQLLHLLTPQA